jgi:hypothetical protein
VGGNKVVRWPKRGEVSKSSFTISISKTMDSQTIWNDLKRRIGSWVIYFSSCDFVWTLLDLGFSSIVDWNPFVRNDHRTVHIRFPNPNGLIATLF